jgi:hypothetical protein
MTTLYEVLCTKTIRVPGQQTEHLYEVVTVSAHNPSAAKKKAVTLLEHSHLGQAYAPEFVAHYTTNIAGEFDIFVGQKVGVFVEKGFPIQQQIE